MHTRQTPIRGHFCATSRSAYCIRSRWDSTQTHGRAIIAAYVHTQLQSIRVYPTRSHRRPQRDLCMLPDVMVLQNPRGRAHALRRDSDRGLRGSTRQGRRRAPRSRPSESSTTPCSPRRCRPPDARQRPRKSSSAAVDVKVKVQVLRFEICIRYIVCLYADIEGT